MGQLLNQRQKLFNVQVVPWEDLNKLIREFEPYKNLWITASGQFEKLVLPETEVVLFNIISKCIFSGLDWLRSYDMWMDNPIFNVDADAIEGSVTDMYKLIVKSIKLFNDIPAVQSIALEVKDRIDQFKPKIQLLQSLRNPGMKQRHWDALEAETGRDF